MWGARRQLEARIAQLEAALAAERAGVDQLRRAYHAEYSKLLDRLLAARGVPESPAALREELLGGDLWEEETDLRDDTREAADPVSG